MIFGHVLKKHISMNPVISGLLLSGVVICVYCISIMLGLAVGQYQLATCSNTEASLTIDIDGKNGVNMDELSAYLNSISKKGMVNVLYFTRLESKKILVGWDGTKGNNWFPITSGNFFNKEEQVAGEYVGFVSDNMKNAIAGSGSFEAGEHTYEVIGMGWIVPWSFASARSSQSQIDILGEEAGEKMQYMLIPYKCYKEEFQPEQILAQFNYASYEDLQKYAEKIQDMFPSMQVYLPDSNSDDVLEEGRTQYEILAFLLCMIAGITVIRLMAEWITTYKKEITVLWLCGMPKVRCMLLIYGHWLLYYGVGSIIAIILQYLTFPLLQYVYGNAFPMPDSLIYILAVMFGFSIFCTLRPMGKVVRLYTKRLWGEFVLFVQLICMLEMSFVVLKPVDSYLMEKKQLKAAYVSDLDSMVHFSKNNLIYEQEMKGNRAAAQEIYKLLLEADDVEKVDRCAFENGIYIKTDGKKSNANLVMYSSEMLDIIRLNIEPEIQENISAGCIPILVSSSMAEELPVGTRTEISLAFDDTIKISCEVAGILQRDSAVPVVFSYGDTMELGNMAILPEALSEYKFVVFAKDMDELFDQLTNVNFLIEPKNNISGEKLAVSLQDRMKNYGTVNTYKTIATGALKNRLEENAWHILAFAMLTLIAVFGYGGYLYLMIAQKKNEFAVFYILGMTRKKMIEVIFSSGAILLAVSFGIAALLYPWFTKTVLKIQESYGYTGIFSYGFSAGVLLFILLLSIWMGFRRTGKQAEIELLKGGD